MNIYLEGNVIGHASIDLDGLYATIRCECRFPDKKLYAVLLKSGSTSRSLGTCTPKGDTHILERRLPKKYILKPNTILIAAEKYGDIKKSMLLVPGEPIAAIGLLENATFQINDGRACLILTYDGQEKECKL